jgi:predicted NAD-dependent protein-ADP-ribosyltransferase YbiA (DUF1768 family)
MVLSKINPKISYREIKSVDPDDLKSQVDMYRLGLNDKFGIDIFVAVGAPKNTYEEDNILFFPIYLVKFNNKVMQVGIYEIVASKLMNYMDEENEIEVEKLTDPLFYSFVTKDYLIKNRLKPEKDDEINLNEGEIEIQDNIQDNEMNEDLQVNIHDDQDDQLIPKNREDIFILTQGHIISSLLTEEDRQNAKKNREAYIPEETDNWIQTFLKNKYYSMVDNEGEGDCLFATIRDAFSSIGQQTSVLKIRNKLSEEINEKVYHDFKERYEMFRVSILEDTKKIKELSQGYQEFKAKFNNTIDRNEQKILSENAKKIKQEHDTLVREKSLSNELLKELKFMKGIDSVEKFKKEVRKCSFWAEGWSISTLERILNIKFIILSSEHYKSGDIKNVLLCGEGDMFLKTQNVFNPEFYIIVDHTGNHYKLVGYKKKLILKFAEIPYDIRVLISDKCMEKNSGLFDLIPEFQHFKKSIGKQDLIMDEINMDDYTDSKLRGLYDDNIVFLFYIKSNGKPLPGKGSGEKIPVSEIGNFKKLATIPDWRKKLSNFWVQYDENKQIVPFTIDNHKWASVEHYYQASKFKENNQQFYLSFSLDSGTELSQDPVMAKAAGGKSGKLKKELLRPKEVEIDPDFFGGRHKEEMAKAQSAKFTQIEQLTELLLATKNAKLTHHSRGSPSIIFDDLMLIREKLKH